MNNKQLKAMYEHESVNMKKRFKESLSTINPKMLIVMRKPFMVGNYSLPIVRLTQPITIDGIEHYRALDLTDLEKQFVQLHTVEKPKLTNEEKKNKRNEVQRRYRKKKALEKSNKSVIESDSSLSAKQHTVNGLLLYPLHNARTITTIERDIDDDTYLSEWYAYVDMCNDIIKKSSIAIEYIEAITLNNAYTMRYNALKQKGRVITAIDNEKMRQSNIRDFFESHKLYFDNSFLFIFDRNYALRNGLFAPQPYTVNTKFVK